MTPRDFAGRPRGRTNPPSGHGGGDFAAREMERLQEAAAAVRAACPLVPEAGIVLGTGLGGAAAGWDAECEIPYEDLPHFPRSTAPGHRGRLFLGRIGTLPVAAMRGRVHLYEGHCAAGVAFPVRVVKLLGATTLVSTAAAGCLHDLWPPGDLMLVGDHVNLQGTSPLAGANLDALGPRFPDMSAPYDAAIQEQAMKAAAAAGIRLWRGVYAAVAGPQLETPAELRLLRAMGADVVGMSMAPEVIAARHMGMRVAGLCVVTNTCLPAPAPATAESVVLAARAAAPKLARVIEDVLAAPARAGGALAGDFPGTNGPAPDEAA